MLVTDDKRAYVDVAFSTQNDSYNKILKFGTPYAEQCIVASSVG